MNTYVAEIGEIVRAQRRDEEAIDELGERISKVVKELLGQRKWIRWFPYFRTAAATAYYACTTLAGNQTLGEEYVRLFESEGLNRVVPGVPARLAFVFLHCVAPVLSNYLIQQGEHKLAHPSTNSFLGVPIQKNHKARRAFFELLSWLRSTAFPNVQRLHLAVFYVFGAYYSLARRFVGVRFLSANPQTDLPALKVYRFLGYVTIGQFLLSLAVGVYAFVDDQLKRDKERSDIKKAAHRKSGGDVGASETGDVQSASLI